ncbi:glycosyltransferase family 24 protein [Fomitopsis serialis]|uniref:glycosyltransferase family 24 protein n=1 Tax=Fomitopsis serialis TaxID=139415 RepID=UPI002007ABB6|nr:glycosyltransferase family 24 protein [Neoantrodia serialis]KAH9924083.1 glycosyltransferase family 24 protein [Neoantrodia serialis]
MVQCSSVCALVLSLACTSYALSPPVKVELQSSWLAPPPLLESIESIALEEPEAFFPLLDVLTNPEAQPDPVPTSSEAAHKYAFDTALAEGFLAGPGAHVSAEMNLALHAATPKIEAFYQYYMDRHAVRRDAIDDARCESWVDWYGEVVCDGETLARLAGVDTIGPPNSIDAEKSYTSPKLMSFDHVEPSPALTLERPPRTAILYASLSSANFWELHSFLYASSRAPNPHLEYVLRPIPPAVRDDSKRSYLSGYGVALDLKKMDYLALDDRRQSSDENTDEVDDATPSAIATDPVMALIHQYPENTTADASAPLTAEELLEIDLQAAQIIRDADEPLSILKQLAQNFPRYATSLSRQVTFDAGLAEEVENNQVVARSGTNVVWLNGVLLSEKDMNPFALLRLLRRERGIMQSLTSLGLSTSQALELLTHPYISAAQSASDVLDGIVDASDRQEGGDVIQWLNDFEKDSRYGRWAKTLNVFLRPMYPGQFPNYGGNIFNIVIVADFSQTSSLHFLATTISNILARNFPFRWGIVPIVETEEAAKMARLLFYLMERVGKANALEFVRHISQGNRPMETTVPTVDWGLVRNAFNSFRASSQEHGEAPIPELDVILNGEVGELNGNVEKARAYAARLGATSEAAPHGHAFVNGKHFDLDDHFLQLMQVELREEMEYIQEQLILGILTDATAGDISTYFYGLPVASKRRNKHIYPSSKAGDLRISNLFDSVVKYGFPNGPGSFVYPSELQQVPLTTYVVADLDTEAGQAFVREALTAAGTEFPSRITFIHNPAAGSAEPVTRPQVSSLFTQLIINGLLERASPSRLLKILGFGDVAVPNHNRQIVISPESELDEILGKTELNDEEYTEYIKTSRLVVRDLGFAPGQQGWLSTVIIGPVAPGEFESQDFPILSAYELRKRVQPVIDALQNVTESLQEYDRASYAEVVTLASSLISAIELPDPSEVGLMNTPHKPRQLKYQLLDGEYTWRFHSGDNSTAFYHFGILLDPLSEAAQKWSSLMQWLLEIPGVTIELHLNPAKYGELPLKRFYRYNLYPRLAFDESGMEIHVQTEFTGLPIEPIYTLAMDVPQSWLARPRESLHDLDNILLAGLSAQDRVQGVKAVFDLDYLVVEGHARDMFTNGPPRGLQLQLASNAGAPIADTLVVANLGYLQFRTKPGVFRLEIRPGRGREVFRMESVGNEGWGSPSVEQSGDEITLTSFEGLTLYPRLVRLPGMERVDVLADVAPVHSSQSGLLDTVVSRISSLFGAHTTQAMTSIENKPAEINIFTVASGLLYERFASIMILSVLRNTNHSVKFWFIENFLSPSFLEFLPHFSEAYGFQYELVTYKWPSWLRAQKEKQRIIWAYKILFLDVLFPMDLKKVIFVDADQIVRADLKELVNLDLHGAPYGYTPMGDDNVEMEGFRFWKTGYWKEFLRNLPYHISALYVVDLVRFRQMGAGDILRGHYQQLSADPNSLANLDQDLPNNLQRDVPIFSLPEDWLWAAKIGCTAQKRLISAKTPSRAKALSCTSIPEWEEYDTEIARFARQLAEEGKMLSGIVAADVNVLAEVGSSKSPAPDVGTENEVEESVPRDEL